MAWFSRISSPFDLYHNRFRRGVAGLFAPLGAVAFFCGTLRDLSRVLSGEDVGPPPASWFGLLVEALLVAGSFYGALGALGVVRAPRRDGGAAVPRAGRTIYDTVRLRRKALASSCHHRARDAR